MYRLESIREKFWFCELEHMYAYKVCQDLIYNENYEIWTRIRHYIESSQNAGYKYNLNQSRIYRLAQALLEEENPSQMTELLIEQDNNQYNHNWTTDEIDILLQTNQQATLTEEEEATLQRILQESFNILQPNFDSCKALENLRKNFEGKVALCLECLHARQIEELDINQGLCNECYQELNKLTLLENIEPEASTSDTPINDEKEIKSTTRNKGKEKEVDPETQQEIIKHLEARVQYLEEMNEQLTSFFKDQILYHQERAEYYSKLYSRQNF